MQLKKLMKKIHEKYVSIKYGALFFIFVIPMDAFAGGDNTVYKFINNLQVFLAALGITSGCCLLTWAGYETWFDLMTKHKVAKYVIGTALVVGGAAIGVDALFK